MLLIKLLTLEFNFKSAKSLLLVFLILQSTIKESVQFHKERGDLKGLVNRLRENHPRIMPTKWIRLSEKYLTEKLSNDELDDFANDTFTIEKKLDASTMFARIISEVQQWLNTVTYVKNVQTLIKAGDNYLELTKMEKDVMASLQHAADKASQAIVDYEKITDCKKAKQILDQIEDEMQPTRQTLYKEAKKITQRLTLRVDDEIFFLRLQKVGLIILEVVAFGGAVGGAAISYNAKTAIGIDGMQVFAGISIVACSATAFYLLDQQVRKVDQLQEVLYEQYEMLREIDGELDMENEKFISHNYQIKKIVNAHFNKLVSANGSTCE